MKKGQISASGPGGGVPWREEGRFGRLVADQPTRGFRTGNPGNRLKSRSADQSSQTSSNRHIAATRASWTRGPAIRPSCHTSTWSTATASGVGGAYSRMLKNFLSPRLLKKVQMEGGARCEVRGVLSLYVAAPRERANAADGPFSAAC